MQRKVPERFLRAKKLALTTGVFVLGLWPVACGEVGPVDPAPPAFQLNDAPVCDPENGDFEGCPPMDPTRFDGLINDMYYYAGQSGDSYCYTLAYEMQDYAYGQGVRSMPGTIAAMGWAMAPNWVALNDVLWAHESYRHQRMVTAFHEAAHNFHQDYDRTHSSGVTADAEQRCAGTNRF